MVPAARRRPGARFGRGVRSDLLRPVLPPDPHGFDGDGDGVGCE
ncbi:MAG: hypothetical protein AVDCRST_MAG19-3988 [uncultured Thermomicrobiales bacterium]|uniref:Excalibur calcium-binding domain-containing protein n=1 Tax=uncultured Thermomicrobiales bacterium TaxID=1645740 RepID=A0A6J4VME8_9BACT|nr:MAG: hypothetical protein AVDCRST_MAG19-3988 [uncultured Thermomicrobiales bacterium]